MRARDRERIRRWRESPDGVVQFVRDLLKAEPDPWQVDAVEPGGPPVAGRYWHCVSQGSGGNDFSLADWRCTGVGCQRVEKITERP